jgi:hypothetical protein
MYAVLMVLGSIFGVICFISLALFILFGCDSPELIIGFVVLGVITGCLLLPAEHINEPYKVELPEEAVLVVADVYEHNGNYIKLEAVDQTFKEECAHGPAYRIVEVSDKVVLDLLLDTQSPSVNQLILMEELAAENGVKLPSTMH